MSKRAIDPKTGKLVTIDEWLKAGRQHEPAECEICREPVMPKAVSTATTSVHFAHSANSRCPTVARNRARFASLGPSGRDPLAGKLLRQEFVKNAFGVYTKCSGLCESLRVPEFRAMVAAADEKVMWEYVGLSLKYVPYLLVSTQPRLPAIGVRRFPIYFVFEPPQRYVDELWNLPGRLKQRIWRVREDDGEIDVYEIDDEWLVEPKWFQSVKKSL